MAKLTFIGGASKVTGSAHHLTVKDTSFLIDCGAEQEEGITSENYIEKVNTIPVVDYCLLTHAHFDHCGLIPLAVKRKKIKKRIVSTPATKALAEMILRDSAKIQKQESDNPVYTDNDIDDALLIWDTKDDGTSFSLEDIKVTFLMSSHIIGSASIYIKTDTGNYLFTGDIGTELQQLMDYPPHIPKESVDYLIIESTYGDKIHEKDDKEQLYRIIKDTCNAGGKVLIPVFAVGRLQELLYTLEKTTLQWQIYVDTPMGDKVTKLQEEYALYLKRKIRKDILKGDTNIFGEYKTINTNNLSKELANSSDPCIILSASGMLEGGRILNHLETIKTNKNSSIVFVGYQAQGTRGRRILDGEESVACKVHRLSSFSSHADADELYSYITGLSSLPYKTYLVHGEEHQRNELLKRLKKLKIRVYTPHNLESGEKSVIDTEKKIVITTPVTFFEFKGYKLAPFAGYIIEHEDKIEITDKSWLNELLSREEEELGKSIGVQLAEEKVSKEELSTEMTGDEFKNNIEKLFQYQIFSKGAIKGFYDELKEKGEKAALKFAFDKHFKNLNTGKRRWNPPAGNFSEEEVEKLYELAFNTLKKAVEIKEKNGINAIYNVFKNYVSNL